LDENRTTNFQRIYFTTIPPIIPRIRTIISRLGSCEIIIYDIKTKFAENNLKILKALQNCLSSE